MEFYNNLSGLYNDMTNAPARAEREKSFFLTLLNKYPVKTAVDIGCGTGHLVKMLCKSGIFMYGIDPSEKMLRVAQDSVYPHYSNYSFILGGYKDIPIIVKQPVDAVFTVGNTLPHLLRINSLKAAVKNISSIVREAGICVIQLVNYAKVLKNRERIVNITKKSGHTFIRFYDFHENRITFNILTIDETAADISNTLDSTDLRPWQKDDICPFLKSSGFGNIELFGDYSFSEFDKNTSPALVIIARKLPA